MTELVARSMEEGAWGLVTRFESGGPAHPDEVIEMAKTVARYGGNYTSHTGSEGFEQTKEFEFAIRVAEEAKIRSTFFHFKIRGKPLWGTIGHTSSRSRRRAAAASTSRRISIPTRRCSTAGARSSRSGSAKAGRRSSPSG